MYITGQCILLANVHNLGLPSSPSSFDHSSNIGPLGVGLWIFTGVGYTTVGSGVGYGVCPRCFSPENTWSVQDFTPVVLEC